MTHGHAASPPPHDAVPGRGRGPNPVKKVINVKASDGIPSGIKSGVVERVSPLVNVLIVEDNYINQMILVKFMRQRKIKFELACNGKEAVDKWRVGGFHLVLMDIQMPVMDGIEATREIRRLERVQKIGVFPTDKPNPVENSTQNAAAPAAASSAVTLSSAPSPSSPASPFRSPVIIVALTASAESEDLRRTALLAGCNDYITKPVQFPWLERKIVEWGCMQALIDVDAWKEWKRDLEGTSPGSSDAGTSSSNGGYGNNNSSKISSSKISSSSSSGPTLSKKSFSGSGSISRGLMKRPSMIARSIKGVKATTTIKITECSADSDKKNTEEVDGETSDNIKSVSSAARDSSLQVLPPTEKPSSMDSTDTSSEFPLTKVGSVSTPLTLPSSTQLLPPSTSTPIPDNGI
ncbi:ssk1 response regulator receiver [Modicella reniformis]|uniref:Ssk1 response regulator receiver n=1 Tax=Modicella reniformis TaxID=1440133 RepID=A0A9P6M168_9FUNG|nr:ssk1 response regulator receiver [Modicella reniformis]